MARKNLKNYIKTLRIKSGVGKHHEKHCHVNSSEKKKENAGKKVHCEVVNGEVEISSTGECLWARCSHPQSGLSV